MIGILGKIMFDKGLSQPETVYIEMVKTLFNPFFAGFILCAMLAATISTMDSQLMVISSIAAENFSSAKKLLVSRFSIAIVLAITFVIALTKSKSVMDVVFYAWNGLGCTIGPALFACLYLRKSSYQGVFIGLIGGALASLTLPVMLPELPPMIPGFCVNLCLIILTSNVLPPQNRETTNS